MDASNVEQIADQPLVIVSIVVDLVGQDSVTHHVRMINAGRGLLLPGCILVAMEFRVDVPGHVPHVCDTWQARSTHARAVQSHFCLVTVP